ncbi:MAG: NAD(P)/FAD-dependent oxidoreductase [Actinobacteria bacterium]|nr:NAD(P)/FAD-dependent oxidoreductase [Actinomycetota bacterium]MCI0543323.1 NAD(P)/FAD-dependent oxidoreductase [Actinomycetota bacterium]MCI0678180.1 NAD(P)/FAD-dependent oxidoreductase [Actinomycetota bacterium]
MTERPEHVETLVIGGGQAGLAVGYQLSQRGLPFLIVDANERVGDAWRNRWDSLRLFTPNLFNSLPGLSYPGDRWDLPTKDEFADYLERYAKEFDLPVRTGVRVTKLTRDGQRFVATADGRRFEADNVVVAMSSWQKPRVPEFASLLDPGIVQLHAADYRNPRQLRDGDVLIVGVGNSGAEIALELSQTHRVWLSGRPFGVLPFRPTSAVARVLMPIVGRVIFHRVLTTDTPIGRKARPKMVKGDPLIRVKPKDLAAAGVESVPRTAGVVEGMPQLEDGRLFEVANVIWCTGFDPGLSWIDLPVMGPQEPKHNRGIVEDEPGLYFVGLKFLYAKSSEQIHGVGRDAARIADAIAVRHRAGRDSARPSVSS